jgi:hypothetical protein
VNSSAARAARESTRTTTRALRKARRRHYLAEGDWVDSLYKAYVTVLVAALALFYLSIAAGGAKADGATITEVAARGAGGLGLLLAVLVALGLRSGSRGGPLAPEPADVVHLLLAPVPRGVVLRDAAYRQARGVVLFPTIAGAVAGSIAASSLRGARAEWMLAGAAFGALGALAVWAAALVAAGARATPRVANLVGAVLVAWSVADVITRSTTSPTGQVGRIALLPLTTSWLALLGVVLVVGTVVAGLALIGGASLEQLRRRAHLVSEIRFAATLQDMRSVIVMHRELAQDLPRSRPWWRARHGRGSWVGPAWARDWRGIARWPLTRFTRGLVLAVAAGIAAGIAWNGSGAFVIVAGLAVFVMGIDAVEGLAQETDHPTLPAQYPLPWGDLVLAHLVAPAALLTLFGVATGLTAWLVVGGTAVLPVVAILVLPVAAAGTVGAAVTVVVGAPPPTLFLDLGFPEFAMLFLILRQVIGPALVILGFLPLLSAMNATDQHQSVAGVAASGVIVPAFLVVAAGIWLRSRKAVHA